jgi:hypothetical protein
MHCSGSLSDRRPGDLELLARQSLRPYYHGFHESGPNIGDPDTVRGSTSRGFEARATVDFSCLCTLIGHGTDDPDC